MNLLLTSDADLKLKCRVRIFTAIFLICKNKSLVHELQNYKTMHKPIQYFAFTKKSCPAPSLSTNVELNKKG